MTVEPLKLPCRVATTANITLSGLLTIDGVTLVDGDRVLVKDQTSAVANGIYIAHSGAWARATDFDDATDAVGGTLVSVSLGTVGANLMYAVSGNGPVVIGTDAITFLQRFFLVDSAYRYISFETFGAIGDGTANDQAAIRAAVAFQKAQVALGIQWRLKGKPGAVYYVGTISTSIALDYDNAYIDLNGSTILFAQNTGSTPFLVIGAPLGVYDATNKHKPGPVTIRGGTIDFNKGAQFCRGVHVFGPCKGVRILDMVFHQSAIAAGATPNTGDQWAIQLDNYVNPFTNWQFDTAARAEDVLIQNCKSYDTMQLVAGGGCGVDGLRILDNYVFEPRANGIAVTGIGNLIRMDDVLISRNTIIRAPGAGVYFGHDGISNTFVVNVGDIPDGSFQMYGRNIKIVDNIMQDCGAGVRISGYAQGIHNLLIGQNHISNGLPGSVTARTTDTITVTPQASVQALSIPMHWAIDHHGGTDPVIADTAFDASTDIVTLAAHKLPTGSGITITGATGATMPPGIASGVVYVWQKETDDTGSLWEGMDAATGTPVNRVNFGTGASGNFTVFFATLIQNAIMTRDNVIMGGAEHLLYGVRSSRIDLPAPFGMQIGAMADVSFGGVYGALVRSMPSGGGLQRTVFSPAAEARWHTASSGTYCFDFAPNAAWLYHFDVLFDGCLVVVDGSASASTGAPSRFMRDQVTAANRRGRGWGVRNLRWSLTGASTSFSAFANANLDNCWAFEGASPASSTERFGGTATWFEHPFIRGANLGSIAAGGTASVTVTCTGMRAAENGTMTIQALPMDHKSSYTQILLTAECTTDDQIALTGAYTALTGSIDPPSTTFLFMIRGYR